MYKIDSSKYKALVFDFDGCLVDSEPLQYEGFVRTLRDKLGLDYITFEEHQHIYTGTGGGFIFVKELAKHNRKYDVQKLRETQRAHYFRLIREKGIGPVKGALKLLGEAKSKGMKLALASGSRSIEILKVMKTADIPNIFDVMVTSEEVTKPKPDPEGFLLAAKRLNVSPSKCVVFEDALNGIKAAKAAGMKCFAVGKYIDKDKLKALAPNVPIIKDFTHLTLT